MIRILKQKTGNISIAMLLMVVSVMSGFTMASLALRDIMSFQYDFENVQAQILLRSEAYRGQSIMEKVGSLVVPIPTSERSVEIVGSGIKRTFKIQSMLAPGSFSLDETISATDQKQTTQVHSRVNTKAGVGQAAFSNNRKSIVRKYGVFTLETETFAKFMYFTDHEGDPNGGPVRFYGPDVLYGRVHSNDDIWIRNAGGGNNSGWPTFYGWVTTGGLIRVYPDGNHNFPQQTIFRGGLSEEYPYTVFPEAATTIRRRAQILGPQNYDPQNIVFAEIVGSSCQGTLGRIGEAQMDTARVYTNNSYPPGQGTHAFMNRYIYRDTTWSLMGNSSSANKSRFTHGRLWIKGDFSTYQTYGCGDTIFIVGDITLNGTPKGQDPATNLRDVVGLVAEKSIVIKYGYRGPIDSIRYHETSGANSGSMYGGVWIYAALAALGDGHGNDRKDGVFTFEYQHPHPSVPDVRLNGVLYTRIDLWRRKFPQANITQWSASAPQIDYPWYNPLWPERAPYLERGYINIYGSISQRRRGFVHRNYVDADYPNPNNAWEQTVDWCGGSSSPTATQHNDPVLGFTLGTQNFPGVSGSGVGYQKNYHYDTRFYRTSPIDFPEVNRRDEKPYAGVKWEIKSPRLIPQMII